MPVQVARVANAKTLASLRRGFIRNKKKLTMDRIAEITNALRSSNYNIARKVVRNFIQKHLSNFFIKKFSESQKKLLQYLFDYRANIPPRAEFINAFGNKEKTIIALKEIVREIDRLAKVTGKARYKGEKIIANPYGTGKTDLIKDLFNNALTSPRGRAELAISKLERDRK
ncbi:MAG: hypothetical protein HYW05_02985 [Candidatus Diapherotrites archaeon]|nr:hypothetical protein [Candidatus Diapherotrites archaeon]